MKAIKQTMIDQLIGRINSSPFLLVADYGGMTVPQLETLRAKLAETGAKFHVAKNTFVRNAAASLKYPEALAGFLTGQTAIVTGEADVCAAAKLLKEAGKGKQTPKIRGGVIEGELLDSAKVIALAELPPKDVLRAQLLGVLNQPAQRLVTVLNEPAASLARLLAAKQKKEEEAGS